MEKLTKYNQKLLAAIGTLVLVSVSLLLLIGGGVLATEIFRDFSNRSIRDNALTIETPTDPSSSKDNKVRDQEITFGMPNLIDTLGAIYVMPVSQVNLKDHEYPNEARELLDFNYSSGSKKLRYGYRYSGTYNNIVIYNQKKGMNYLVFDSKTNISSFQHYAINNDQFLLIEGTRTDSNQDKKLDSDDLKSFFSYNISTEELREFTFNSMGLVDYYVTHDSDEVILRFAKDKDKNGEISRYQEPIYLKRLALNDYTINDLIDQKMVDKIQTLID